MQPHGVSCCWCDTLYLATKFAARRTHTDARIGGGGGQSATLNLTPQLLAVARFQPSTKRVEASPVQVKGFHGLHRVRAEFDKSTLPEQRFIHL